MSNKLRMLRVMEFLMRESDEEHIRSADDILRYLESCNIDANIKTVNDDIKVLQEFGIDVIKVKGKGGGSYIGSRNLELPELKLLTDAVKISKFITTKKSEHLINRLKSLTSKGQAEQLSRDIYLQDAVKTGNENIYYNVDCIHTAILKNKEVSFKYNEWTLEKKLKPKNKGMKYVVSPWELTWSDENYYLVGYEEKTGKIKHYRVDKITDIDLMDSERKGEENFSNRNLETYMKKTFGMYGGEDSTVTLKCKNDAIGIILDRFGNGVNIVNSGHDKEHFIVSVNVSVSPQFFGWLTGIGTMIKIVDTEDISGKDVLAESTCTSNDSKKKSVKMRYKEYLEKVLREY